MKSKEIKSFQKRLLSWYKKNARDLPWRRTRDPYKIWVSEIMLQQTQVDTVIPYYKKWLKRFPTLKSLAKASESEVMKYWAGLGYYRRARMLHAGARKIEEELKGQMPKTAESLLLLPGIGRYTAGAIASIAFEQKAPILDGNVIRILSRLFAFKKDVSQLKTIQELWTISESVLPDKSLGDFNQAMMELGAIICSPEKPACLLCPVSSLCAAHKLKKETKFPVKKKKEKLQKIKTAALVLKQKNKFLIKKQPAEGRWGGLWMFPHWKTKQSMKNEINISSKLNRMMTVKHGFTKYQIELEVFKPEDIKESVQLKGQTRWASLKELPKMAFPSPHQKIVKELIKNEK